MHTPPNPVWRHSLLALPLLALNAVSTATARADSVALATEVMMEDTAANNLIVGALFQPSVGSSLTYNTTMAADGTSYSYSTVAGSTLDGNPISLTGGANEVYSNPTLGIRVWKTYESGSYLGSPYWSVVDREVLFKNPDGSYTIISNYDYYDKNGNKTGDLHLVVKVNSDLTMDTDTGYFTNKYGDVVPNSNFTSTSQLGSAGKWDIEILPEYPSTKPPGMPDRLADTGYTPTSGGSGYFTATFVPEPSAWTLLSLGTLGLLGLARRRRNR